MEGLGEQGNGLVLLACTRCAGAAIVVLQSDGLNLFHCIPRKHLAWRSAYFTGKTTLPRDYMSWQLAHSCRTTCVC